MEQKMFDWLKADIEKVDTRVEEFKSEVNVKLDKMAGDITQMLEFKWQIIGGSVVASFVIGIFIQLFLSFYSKGQ